MTLLGRLAVDKQHQKNRLGEHLLIDALNRSLCNSHTIGSMAVIVQAINDEAIQFYKRYDFKVFADRADLLYIPMLLSKKRLKNNFSV